MEEISELSIRTSQGTVWMSCTEATALWREMDCVCFIQAAQLCYCSSLLWQKIEGAELLTHFSGRMMLQNPEVLLKSLACNPTLLLQIAWPCSLLLNSSFTEELIHRAQVGSPSTNNPTLQRLPMPQREVTRNSIHTRIFILINRVLQAQAFFF